MSNRTSILKGVMHGKTIGLEHEPGLPEGQQVTVSVQSTCGIPKLPPGEGLRRAFGGWAEDADKLEEFVEQIYRDRDDRAGSTT